jgi:LuxR family transcriptional regulator, maltose regulon positive regulatory protein
MVARTALVERLLTASGGAVVCVVAPPGYGKTTLLAQWAQRKGGRVGWLTVDPHDNDPAVLLTYLAVALDRVASIEPETLKILASPSTHVPPAVVPRLAAAMSATTEPVALVLDHVELLDNGQCLDALAQLALQLAGESQLALASRTQPRLPLGRLRGQGRLMEVGAADLAMDPSEARALLEGAEVRLPGEHAAELHRRTEGWPVGLYLAALALQAAGPTPDTPAAGVAFAGDDRFVVDYLNAELLARLPPRQVSFLTRTAVLDRMCGPLCDAVLDTTGSATVLESLAGSNLLLVPLDGRREWYRYHHLCCRPASAWHRCWRESPTRTCTRRRSWPWRGPHRSSMTWTAPCGRRRPPWRSSGARPSPLAPRRPASPSAPWRRPWAATTTRCAT